MKKRIPLVSIIPKPKNLLPPRPPVPEHLSVPQVAALVGVSMITIFKRIKSGSLKAEKVGRNYVVHLDDLINAIGIDFRR